MVPVLVCLHFKYNIYMYIKCITAVKLVTYGVIPVIVLYVLVISTGSFFISLPRTERMISSMNLQLLYILLLNVPVLY